MHFEEKDWSGIVAFFLKISFVIELILKYFDKKTATSTAAVYRLGTIKLKKLIFNEFFADSAVICLNC
jgi:hypothetical protein